MAWEAPGKACRTVLAPPCLRPYTRDPAGPARCDRPEAFRKAGHGPTGEFWAAGSVRSPSHGGPAEPSPPVRPGPPSGVGLGVSFPSPPLPAFHGALQTQDQAAARPPAWAVCATLRGAGRVPVLPDGTLASTGSSRVDPEVSCAPQVAPGPALMLHRVETSLRSVPVTRSHLCLGTARCETGGVSHSGVRAPGSSQALRSLLDPRETVRRGPRFAAFKHADVDAPPERQWFGCHRGPRRSRVAATTGDTPLPQACSHVLVRL